MELEYSDAKYTELGKYLFQPRIQHEDRRDAREG